jgi:hypothetical protein
LGRDSTYPAGPASSSSVWAGVLLLRSPAGPPCPGLPLPRLGRQVLTQLGRSPFPPAGPASCSAPPNGWADVHPSAGPTPPAGRRSLRPRPDGPISPQCPTGPDQEDPAWPGFVSRPPSVSPGWDGLVCSGRARPGFPWPRPDYSSPGRISPFQADLAPPGPGFTSFGTYSSSGIDSSALCQSWDALWLRLAHPPSSYAGLGTPLGSDQHTLPLLVSLILGRRIRLMTWRSRRQ